METSQSKRPFAVNEGDISTEENSASSSSPVLIESKLTQAIKNPAWEEQFFPVSSYSIFSPTEIAMQLKGSAQAFKDSGKEGETQQTAPEEAINNHFFEQCDAIYTRIENAKYLRDVNSVSLLIHNAINESKKEFMKIEESMMRCHLKNKCADGNYSNRVDSEREHVKKTCQQKLENIVIEHLVEKDMGDGFFGRPKIRGIARQLLKGLDQLCSKFNRRLNNSYINNIRFSEEILRQVRSLEIKTERSEKGNSTAEFPIYSGNDKSHFVFPQEREELSFPESLPTNSSPSILLPPTPPSILFSDRKGKGKQNSSPSLTQLQTNSRKSFP